MFDFTITPDEPGIEPFKLSAGMRDVVMWERTHKGRAFAQLGDGGMSATMLFEIAYSACRRQQLVPRELTEAQFMATYDITVHDEDEQAADEQPAAETPPAPAASDPYDLALDGPADPTRSGA